MSAAGATPPPEIAFLAGYGAPLETLLKAGRIAEDIGVSPDCALLREGLAQEEFFYRALADTLGAPYHVGGAALDSKVSPARALNAGFVYLDPLGAPPYRAIAAPRGEVLRLLLEAADAGRRISGLALTSPRRLGALVRVERAQEIAAQASLRLERLDPSLSARGEIRPGQTLAVAGFAVGLIGLSLVAPWAERALLSLSLWTLFSAAIFLRIAAAIAAGASPPAPPVEDAHLPVYTVIVAMYREGAVIAKLVAGLNAFDYPGIR